MGHESGGAYDGKQASTSRDSSYTCPICLGFASGRNRVQYVALKNEI
jgi:hypothetical protein